MSQRKATKEHKETKLFCQFSLSQQIIYLHIFLYFFNFTFYITFQSGEHCSVIESWDITPFASELYFIQAGILFKNQILDPGKMRQKCPSVPFFAYQKETSLSSSSSPLH